jgi:beta-N-acetylhexosaminidase
MRRPGTTTVKNANRRHRLLRETALLAAAATLSAVFLWSSAPFRPAAAEPSSLHQVAAGEMLAKANAKRARKSRKKQPPAPLAKETSAKALSRSEILASDPAILERLGRHIVIGYHSPATVKALVEKKAIAGIFITDHNVRRRKVDDIRTEIDALQAIRVGQGLPPLIIAADQEGGAVSRLSPPLARQPSLARVLAAVKPGEDVKAAVVAYARKQASELKRIGVNLNFAPVVDLKIDPRRRSDGQTQLRFRALSADPKTVSDAAGWYCDTLAEDGIFCTIKHFPGLGRVALDTHRHAGDIKAPLAELKGADWVPFRDLMQRPHVVTMLAHVRLRELDQDSPASFSKAVIDGLMRTEWDHSGLLITDDFSMGAVTRSKDGIGAASVKALNAGTDLLLVSFSDKHLNTVMTALIDAEKQGAIDPDQRSASLARLKNLPAAHAPLPPEQPLPPLPIKKSTAVR